MSYITNKDSSVLPYNDEYANYDINKRRYILTENGLKNLSGVNINDYVDSTQEKEMYLDEFSLDVYDYIYEYTLAPCVKYKRFLFAKSQTYRDILIEAMALHARGSLRSGLFLLKDQHGVNLEKGKVIDLKNLRGDVTLAGSAIRALKRDRNLLYTGNIPFVGYYDDGTY